MEGTFIGIAARTAALLLLGAGCATAPRAQTVGRLAEVQVYDRTTHEVLATYWHDGRPYVVGRPGDEYEVVVRNMSRGELLAVVSVDGVNVLSGATASPRQGGYVMSPWERLAIKGWRKSTEQVAAFYFTSLGDSYAARTGRPANVGVIGVALFTRRVQQIVPLDASPPPIPIAPGVAAPAPPVKQQARAPDANASSQESLRRAEAAPLGTGHGRREDSSVTYVPFQRASDDPVETIAIYYDSYRNLVAQGVIPAYGSREREPQPFPGQFVPDPPGR
jgi:hypothetical protein